MHIHANKDTNIYTHTHMRELWYTCMHTFIHTCVRVGERAYMRTHIRACTYIRTYKAYILIHTYTHTYKQTYMHTYIHTYMHAYIYSNTHNTHAYIHTHIRRPTYMYTNTHKYIYTCLHIYIRVKKTQQLQHYNEYVMLESIWTKPMSFTKNLARWNGLTWCTVRLQQCISVSRLIIGCRIDHYFYYEGTKCHFGMSGFI
jgi:hypothetical protein